MSNKYKSPEESTQQTTDDTARLLSNAVIHFTDEALDSRLQPFLADFNKLTIKAEEVVQDQQSALTDFKSEIKAAPTALTRFLTTVEGRLSEVEVGFRDALAQAVSTVGASFEENLKTIMSEINEVSKAAHSAESALTQAGEAYLMEADARLQTIEAGHGELVRMTIGMAAEEFDKQLLPLLNRAVEVSAAAHSTETALRECGETFLKHLREQLALIEEGHQSLIVAGVETVAGAMHQNLQPLLSSTADAALRTEAASVQLDNVCRILEVSLEDIRQGVPVLRDSIDKTNSHLDAISRLQVAGNDELKGFDQRFKNIEGMLERTTRNMVISFIIIGAAMSGTIIWLITTVR